MSLQKILHIAPCDKFIPPFIEFVKEHFDFKVHVFLLTGGMAQGQLKSYANVTLAERTILERLKFYAQAIIKMHKAKKVIFHGLFDSKLVCILFLMPWLLKKCYWVMWGGDLYEYQLGKRNWAWEVKEFFRRPVIKNMGYLVTGTQGDLELAREWYGAKGEHIKCFNYPSNIYKEYYVKPKQHEGINILLGNSADPSNNHLELFDKLEPFKDKNIHIYAPMTYGNSEYAKMIIEQGKKSFGNKFYPLTEHMPFNEYFEFLGKIDIAVFNHRRSQALGNTITLLGLGKKVYLNSVSNHNDFFEGLGITVFDVKDFNINLIDSRISKKNINKVRSVYSKDSLVNSLSKWIQ